MKQNHSSKPIGIFDSGIGGLTVAQSIVKHLPKENLIYFGDTAHMPYGNRSTAAIQAYAIKIANLLLEQECKLILIACFSATAAAFELVKEYVGGKAIVMNVIDPTIRLLKEQYSGKRVGLIGTKQTVNSDIHQKKIMDLNANVELTSFACGLLAAAIEEFGNHSLIDRLLETYLTHPSLQNIDALVLACTHYPIVKEKIAQHFKKQIDVIDTSDIVALAVKKQLEMLNLLNANGSSKKHFYVSDYTDSFAENAKLFFNEDVTLEYYPLWD